MNKLLVRVLAASVMAPVTIFLILWGHAPFVVLITIGAFIALYEWVGLTYNDKHRLPLLVIGCFYVALSGGSYIFMRFAFDQGAWLTLTVMVCIWASDSAAYFTGKAFGGRKLAPLISPNKTWSGFGGAMAGFGAMLVIMFLLGVVLESDTFHSNAHIPPTRIIPVFLAGCVLGAVAQGGDLLISLLKRRVGAKDSGKLIPGHGGLLDRIDALMLAIPAFLILCMVAVR
jgi:phosphatidate cytidylyltransferase